MLKKRLETYRTYQRFLRTQFIICGCWYMPTKSGKPRYYWSVCVLFFMFIYLIISWNTSYANKHKFADLIRSIIAIIAAFSSFLKVGTFLINRDSLIKYHRTLNDLFEEELARNEKIRTIIFSSLPATCTLAYSYSAVLMSLILAYIVPPYLSIIRDLCHFRLTTNYILPNKGYGYFWIIPDNFTYHLHLLLETLLIILACFVTCTVDSAFCFYVYQFASTMRAMIFRLRNPLPTEKFSDILRTCVEKHQKLLRCRDTLEQKYGPIVLWHIITNALVLCGLIYEFSDFTISNIFIFLTYSTIKLLQTLIFAWYGSVLISASEDFRKGIYFSEWANSDRHVKANIILIMMQKPMAINALFIPVDAVMFKNFVNTSMSYLCLLRAYGG